MECCATNIEPLGCFPFHEPIETGWLVDLDGTWKVITWYHGQMIIRELELETGDEIELDAVEMGLNEDYTYVFMVYTPTGEVYDFGGYDGFTLKIVIAG